MEEAASDVVEEILLRLPADDPRSLIRAALVCKSWCRLVSDPGFNRRFRQRQTSVPPVLGFFCCVQKFRGQGIEQRFIPLTSSFPRLPHAFMPSWGAVDARHGRVLFYDDDKLGMNRPVEKLHFIVWDPITAEVSRLPVVPVHNNSPMDTWNAALLICDDDPSPSSGFRVAVVAVDDFFFSACVYSSDQNVWSTPISVPRSQSDRRRLSRGSKALIGNALYSKFYRCPWLVEYDVSKQKLSFISMPRCKNQPIASVTTAEDGGLGFAVVLYSNLYTYTWSRDACAWAQQRLFELDKMLPLSDAINRSRARVAAAANAFSLIFLETTGCPFLIDFKSGQARKIDHPSDGCYICIGVVPYATFFTPVVGSVLL